MPIHSSSSGSDHEVVHACAALSSADAGGLEGVAALHEVLHARDAALLDGDDGEAALDREEAADRDGATVAVGDAAGRLHARGAEADEDVVAGRDALLDLDA